MSAVELATAVELERVEHQARRRRGRARPLAAARARLVARADRPERRRQELGAARDRRPAAHERPHRTCSATTSRASIAASWRAASRSCRSRRSCRRSRRSPTTSCSAARRTPALLGREGAADHAAVAEVLERLDLVDLAARSLATLSGGELQRAVLARALAQGAQLLLLDEPTSALDIGHQQDVLELVATQQATGGLTVISAMHDLTLAGPVRRPHAAALVGPRRRGGHAGGGAARGHDRGALQRARAARRRRRGQHRRRALARAARRRRAGAPVTLTFVTGGARSGKSRYALRLAEAAGSASR